MCSQLLKIILPSPTYSTSHVDLFNIFFLPSQQTQWTSLGCTYIDKSVSATRQVNAFSFAISLWSVESGSSQLSLKKMLFWKKRFPCKCLSWQQVSSLKCFFSECWDVPVSLQVDAFFAQLLHYKATYLVTLLKLKTKESAGIRKWP